MGDTVEYDILASHCKGVGLNLCCCDKQIADSIGVDADPAAKAVKVLADVRALPFATGTLDYVICNHGLEHIRDAPLQVIHEWLRVLRVGGTLAIIVPDGSVGEKSLNYASMPGEILKHGYSHGHLFTLPLLEALISFAGGNVIDSQILERSHVINSIYVSAVKTGKHTPDYQPFCTPLQVVRLIQQDGIWSVIKRIFRRLR